MRALSLLSALLLGACGSAVTSGPDAAIDPPDAELLAADASGGLDAGAPDAENKAAHCASSFGSELTNSFGRLDGTVLAVVAPTDLQCPTYNGDHLLVEIQMHGAVYRIVVNVLSDGRNGTDTRLRYAEVRHLLVGDPWSEGWHPGLGLDYANSLGAHVALGFTPLAMNDLVQKVTSRFVLGTKVSAFATSSGGTRADSAHLVHRNASSPNSDGALVIDPDTTNPMFLLFSFDGDSF